MDVLLHPRTKAALNTLIRRPSGSYLFSGPRGVGKATTAIEITHRLICDSNQQHPSCSSCGQLEAGTYPDLEILQPETKPSISIEQVRVLIERLSRRPYYAGKIRVALIDDAGRLTIDAANALLKIVEEPPDQTIFILVADEPQSLLETIRSRCGLISFAPPSQVALSNYLTTRFNLASDQATNLVTATVLPGPAISAASDPEALLAHTQLADDASEILRQDLFNRLQLATRLASSVDGTKLARVLHAGIIRELLEGANIPDQSRRLEAVEQFRRHISAGLSNRIALERLMLEL